MLIVATAALCVSFIIFIDAACAISRLIFDALLRDATLRALRVCCLMPRRYCLPLRAMPMPFQC